MSKVKLIVGIGLMLAGTVLSIAGLSSEPEVLSESDQKQIDTLKTDIRLYTERDQEFGQVSADILTAVSQETQYDEVLYNKIIDLAQQNGLIITDQNSYAKANEANIKKCYYSLEGYGDIRGIVVFLKSLNTTDRALLIESVALRDQMELIGNFEDENAARASGLKSFSVIVEDSHKRDLSDLEKQAANSGSEAVSSKDDKGSDSTSSTSSTSSKDKDKGSSKDKDKGSSAVDSEPKDPKEEGQQSPGDPQISSRDESSSSSDKVSSGLKNEQGSNVSSKHEHKWSEPFWKSAPTHEKDGVKVRVCELCKDVEEFSDEECSSDKGHTYGDGICGGRTCTVCGAKETEVKHLWGQFSVYSEATCDQIGWNEHVCVSCGTIEQIESPMTPHDFKKNAEGKMVCTYCGVDEESAGIPVEVS